MSNRKRNIRIVPHVSKNGSTRVTELDVEHIQNQIKKDSTKILQHNPFSENYNKISNIKSLHISRLRKKEDIKLALISLPKIKGVRSKVSYISNPRQNGIETDFCERRTCTYSKRSATNLLKSFTDSLDIALSDLKADIVCFNEHGLPIPSFHEIWKSAIDYSIDSANRHKSLILAGTSHDSRTCYNTAHIIYPGCQAYGILYNKQISAQYKKLPNEELINIPPKRISYCTKAFGLNTTFLICLDIADYTTVASVINMNEGINLLLVPSYAEWLEPLEKIALTLSKAISGGVGLVNHYMGSEKPSSVLYMYGKKEPMRSSTREKLGDRLGEIAIYDIKSSEMKTEKIKRQSKVNQNLQWLFGYKSILDR